MALVLPSGWVLPPGRAIQGDFQTVYDAVFGPMSHDQHVTAWKHHLYRMSSEGRDAMRARLRALYPFLSLEQAHVAYAAITPTYYFDQRYI